MADPVFSRILCPVDGSPTSERGALEAIRLASALGAQLRFFSVVDLQPLLVDAGVPVTPDLLDALRDAADDAIAQARQRAEQQGLVATTGVADAFGTRVSDAIIAEAERWSADLIVIGTHGRRGVRRLMMGSDAEAVARQAPCEVLLVRASAAEAAAPAA